VTTYGKRKMPESTRPKDAWLALRCQLGEADAFRELVAEMERPLMYFASKVLGTANDAPDVLQEVWLRAFAKIGALRDVGALRPWLYQLTRATAVSRVRSDIARERRESAAVDDGPAPVDEGTDARPFEEDAATLHRALDALSLEHREVLTLHFLEDLSLEEIASVVSVPVGTVKSRLFHAKRRLRDALGVRA
jgi:RNA polymerase sigma-70 factor (ECF subfamily)